MHNVQYDTVFGIGRILHCGIASRRNGITYDAEMSCTYGTKQLTTVSTPARIYNARVRSIHFNPTHLSYIIINDDLSV